MPNPYRNIGNTGTRKQSNRTGVEKPTASGRPVGSLGHRTDAEREEHRRRMPELMRKGWSVCMIAEEFGVTRDVVYQDWRRILRDWEQERKENVNDLITQKLEEYAKIKREAWEAWEESKANCRTWCMQCGGSGKVVNRNDGEKKRCKLCKGVGQVKTGGEPDVRHLKVVLDSINGERSLLGLDKARKLDVRGAVISWETLVATASSEGGNEVFESSAEEKIRELESSLQSDKLLVDRGHTDGADEEE